MKTFTQWLLALLLVATPMLVAIQFASANTELAPASRLVAPYYDISGSRSTFFLLTNVTTANLNGPLSATSIGAVHVQFYNKGCDRADTTVNLSPGDIDQLNVTPGIVLFGSTLGFADIDVRANPALPDSTSIQANALLGEVVITDTAVDFALSYPMASSLGSAASGFGAPIVTRDTAGLANVWTGRYEPFPTRLFVPGFYAGGGTGAGAISTATSPSLGTVLAVVSPADGFWYGGVGGTGPGEAPGQPLGPLPAGSFLIKAGILVWDGCEHPTSKTLQTHAVIGSLEDLFGTAVNRDLFPWVTAASGTCGATFAQNDELANVPLGWIDFPNVSTARAANHNNPATAGSPTFGRVRGIVGVLFENAGINGSTLTGGDVARLWGGVDTITMQTGCLTSDGGTRTGANCSYNFATGVAPNNVTFP